MNAFLDQVHEMSVFSMIKYIYEEKMRWFNEYLIKEIEEWDFIIKNIIKSIEICIKNYIYFYKEKRLINAIYKVISWINIEIKL